MLKKVPVIIRWMFGKGHPGRGLRMDRRRSESTEAEQLSGFDQMRDDGVGGEDGEELDSRHIEEMKATGLVRGSAR